MSGRKRKSRGGTFAVHRARAREGVGCSSYEAVEVEVNEHEVQLVADHRVEGEVQLHPVLVERGREKVEVNYMVETLKMFDFGS